MKWLWLLMSKTLTKRRTLTCIITVALAFVLSMFMSGTHAMDGFQRAYDQRLTNVYGYYHAVFYNIYAEKENIRDDAVDKVGFFEIYDKKDVDSALSDIVIGYADDDTVDLHRITLKEGRMPENENEAVIEEWLTKNDELNLQIGSTYKATYSSPDEYGEFADESVISVTIVGIVNDYSAMQTNNLSIEYEKAVLPNVITGGKLQQNNIKSCSVHIKNAADYDEIIRRLNEDVIFAGRYSKNVNRYDDGELTVANELVKSTTESIFILISIFCLLLMLLVQFLYIYAQNKNLGISNKLGLTGLLKTWFVVALNMSVVLLAIIPGVLLGIGLSALFSVLLTNVFEIEILSLVSLKTILYSVILFVLAGFASSFICALIERGMTRSKRKTKKPSYMPSTSSPYKLMAYKTILYSPSKFVLVSVSISLCMTLMCFGLVYKGQSANVLNSEDDIYDYNIYTAMSSISNDLNIPLGYGDASEITDKKLQALCENAAVGDYALSFMTQVNVLTDKGSESDLFFGEHLAWVSDGGFSDYGYGANNLYKTTIYCMDAKDFDLLENCIIYGAIDKAAIQSGKEIIVTFSKTLIGSGMNDKEKAYAEALKSMVGKELTLTQVAYLEDQNDLSSGKRHDVTTKLGAVVIIPPEEKQALQVFSRNGSFTGGYSFFKENGFFFDRFECKVRLAAPEYANIFEKAVKSDIGNYENVKIASSNQSRLLLRRTLLILDSVIGGVTIVLCGFALIFILINYGQNIITKKRLYQQLYVIGATPNQINIIMLLEYISAMMLAVVLAAIPIAVLSYLLSMFDNAWSGAVSVIVKSFLIPVIILVLLCVPLYIFNKKWLAKVTEE